MLLSMTASTRARTRIAATALAIACGMSLSACSMGPYAGTESDEPNVAGVAGHAAGEQLPVVRAVALDGAADVIAAPDDTATQDVLDRLGGIDIAIGGRVGDTGSDDTVLMGVTTPQYTVVDPDNPSAVAQGVGVNVDNTGAQLVRVRVGADGAVDVTTLEELPVPDGYAQLVKHVIDTGVMDFTAQRSLAGWTLAQTYGVGEGEHTADVHPSARLVLGAVGSSAAMMDQGRTSVDGEARLSVVPGGVPITGMCALETPDAVRLSHDHEQMISDARKVAQESGGELDPVVERELRDTAGTGAFVSVDGQPSLVVRDAQDFRVTTTRPIVMPVGGSVGRLDTSFIAASATAAPEVPADTAWMRAPVGGTQGVAANMGMLPGVTDLACLPVGASKDVADALDVNATTLGVGLIDPAMYWAALGDAATIGNLTADQLVAQPQGDAARVGEFAGDTEACTFGVLVDIDSGVVRGVIDFSAVLEAHDAVAVRAVSVDTVRGYEKLPGVWCVVLGRDGHTRIVRAGLEF
mgnify:CR=1 FL=1